MPLPKEHSYTIEDIYALPEGQRAELIDGKLYDIEPPDRIHQKLVMELSVTIRNHIRSKDGSCEVYPAPFAVFLNADEETSSLILVLFVTRISSQTEAVRVLQTSLLRLSLPEAARWTIPPKIPSTPTPVFGNTGSWISPRNARPFTDMKRIPLP